MIVERGPSDHQPDTPDGIPRMATAIASGNIGILIASRPWPVTDGRHLHIWPLRNVYLVIDDHQGLLGIAPRSEASDRCNNFRIGVINHDSQEIISLDHPVPVEGPKDHE